MREFQDESGGKWVATIQARPGDDYKGRYCLVLAREGGEEAGPVSLEDVRWNSPTTAERTLRTMSPVELRRRLRWARGRVPGAS